MRAAERPDESSDPSADAREAALARALELPAPVGGGRLETLARGPVDGVAIAIDRPRGLVAVARESDVVLTRLDDLAELARVPIPGAWTLDFASERGLLCVAGRTGVHFVTLDDDGPHVRFAMRNRGPVTLAVSPGETRLAFAGAVAHPRSSVGVFDMDRRRFDWTAVVPAAAAAVWSGPEVVAVAGRGVDLLAWDGRRLPRLGTRPLDAACAWGAHLVVAGRAAVGDLWHVDGTALVGAIPVPIGVGRRSLAMAGDTLLAGTLAHGGALALIGLPEGRVLRVLGGVRAADADDDLIAATGPAGTLVARWRTSDG